MCWHGVDRLAGQGTASACEIRQQLQSALCTAKAGEVVSITEQQDTVMALREAELSPHAGSGAWLSPALLPGLMGMGGTKAFQLPATGKQISRTHSIPSWHSWGKWQ